MDFEFTEDQNLLSDAVQRFMTTRYGSEQRRAILKSPGAWSREVWSSLTEIGLVGLLVPAEQGGMGGGPVETMLAMNAFGAGILLEPYWSSAVFATVLLKKLGGPHAAQAARGPRDRASASPRWRTPSRARATTGRSRDDGPQGGGWLGALGREGGRPRGGGGGHAARFRARPGRRGRPVRVRGASRARAASACAST